MRPTNRTSGTTIREPALISWKSSLGRHLIGRCCRLPCFHGTRAVKRQVHEVFCTGSCSLQERLLAQKCTFSSNLPAVTSQKNCSKEDVLASTGNWLTMRGRLQARNRCVAPFQEVIILENAREVARASMPPKRIYNSLHQGKARGPQTP